MELSYLLVADYANTTQDGKLNVMGIFSHINAYNFPAVHPEMYLVAQLTAGPTEYGRKCKITIQLMDADAKHKVLDYQIPVVVPSDERGQKVHLNHILRLVNTPFPHPGTYAFYVSVDNDSKGDLPIEINLIPRPDTAD